MALATGISRNRGLAPNRSTQRLSFAKALVAGCGQQVTFDPQMLIEQGLTEETETKLKLGSPVSLQPLFSPFSPVKRLSVGRC